MMQTKIQGEIEQYTIKPTNGDYLHAITIGGVRYSGFSKQKEPKEGCKEGDVVTFIAEQSGEYWNIKSGFQIKKRSDPSQPKKVKATPSNVGVMVGHAVSNAVNLECKLGGDVDWDRVEENARRVMDLSLRLQNQMLSGGFDE